MHFHVSIMTLVMTLLIGQTACAKPRLIWMWANHSERKIGVRADYRDPTENFQLMRAGGLNMSPGVGGGSNGDYYWVPPELEVRWFDAVGQDRKRQLDDPGEWKSQVVKIVGIDREHFRGYLWMRFDGKEWTVWPQTEDDLLEHRLYSVYPNAPWSPRLTDVPRGQYKAHVFEKYPWVNDLIVMPDGPGAPPKRVDIEKLDPPTEEEKKAHFIVRKAE